MKKKDFIKKVENKINRLFPEKDSFTEVGVEIYKDTGYELILNIKSNSNKKISTISFIPDGNERDGEYQDLKDRPYNKNKDFLSFSTVSSIGHSIDELEIITRGLMRTRRIVRDIENNGSKYNRLLIEYKKQFGEPKESKKQNMSSKVKKPSR